MKTKFLFAIAVLVLSACSDNDSDDNGNGNNVPPVENTELRIDASLGSLETKVGDNTWEATDAIGVFVIKDGGSIATSEDMLFPNSGYVNDNAPTWSATKGFQAFKFDANINPNTTKPLYPTNDDKIQLVGYHPYNAQWVSATALYRIDLSNQSEKLGEDLLYAPMTTGTHQKSTSATPIDLKFSHKLSKVIIQLKAGTGITNEEVAQSKMEMGYLLTVVNFTISTGDVTAGVNGFVRPLSTTPPTGIDAQFEAIFVPQALTTATYKIYHSAINKTFSWRFITPAGADLPELKAGYKYIYTVTLNASSEPSIKCQIVDWATGVTIQ